MNLPVVAIVGRPNVGKSALFNKLIGRSDAIVSEEAGTTRDRHFGQAEWNGRSFWLVDTGGVTDDPNVPMDVEIKKQVAVAIGEADLSLLVVDVKAGMHPIDRRVVDLLRDKRKPWMLVCNKSDEVHATDFYEFYNLGAGDPFPVSATNGRGTGDLLDALVERIPEADPEPSTALRVAVIGRPNVGKSSFVNRLLGEDRLVVSEVAGTTRDAIDTPLMYHDRELIFVDTAGLRRQARIEDGLEFYSSLRTRRAIDSSAVCLLMVDASEGQLHNQDLKIATMAWEAGRGLILIVNKWDLVEKDGKTADQWKKKAIEKAPYLAHVPMLFTSARTGLRVQKVLDLVLAVDVERSRRISTSEVNKTLEALLARRQPPQAAGVEVRLNYATQVEVEPPTIAVFGNHPELVQEHYIRYLHNGFREEYGFAGTPLRMIMRHKSGRE
jgi:GTPase